MVSLWLLILLANHWGPPFSDPSACCPSNLEYTVLFPAVTLAALHKPAFPAWLCCLRSSHLNPPWQAAASQVGPASYHLMRSAKRLMTHLYQERQAVLLAPKGIGVSPNRSRDPADMARWTHSLRRPLTDCLISCPLLLKQGRDTGENYEEMEEDRGGGALLPRTQNVWMSMAINTIKIIIIQGSSTSGAFIA